MSKLFKNHPTLECDVLMGLEPYFGKDVVVATINHESKRISPTHGYFYPHKHGKASKAYARKVGYSFNNN